ncbi:MAG: putative lytic murein transglycosylase [Gammaproteobacteria bacterium]|nr:putative lytic murein transglycosylase [Gammaproteobacteria bacterium]
MDDADAGDLWLRLGAGIKLDRYLQQRTVQEKLSWYGRNQEYLDRVSERARPYLYFIVEELERRDMPTELALLPIVESAFHPFAHSPSSASGIWQFIPSTGIRYGLKQNWWYDGRRDIVAATHAALDYLGKLNQEFNGDWLLALAAYNTGEKNVARAIQRNKQMGRKWDFWSLSLPRETRGYVPSLLAVAELVANPGQHGIAWKPIPDKQYFAQVETGGQLDLALVAELSEQTMNEVYILNPAYNRWATDPDGPHSVLIPMKKSAAFKSRLSELPKEERITWTRHAIKRGESLGTIAQQYHISTEALKQANGLRGNLVHTGNSLLIPTARQPDRHYSMSADARLYQGLQKTGAGEKYVYTVQRGDNLWDIGQRYGLGVERLCAWNGIPPNKLLRPGQKLTLWLATDKNTKVAANSSKPETSNNNPVRVVTTAINPINLVTYTVKIGDSLWLIARRFGTTVTQLMTWNHLARGSMLKPGQQLNVQPVAYHQADAGTTTLAAKNSTMNYTVKKGDTLWLISRRFGTTITQIVQWNNLSDTHLLQPGQTLVLYPNEA